MINEDDLSNLLYVFMAKEWSIETEDDYCYRCQERHIAYFDVGEINLFNLKISLFCLVSCDWDEYYLQYGSQDDPREIIIFDVGGFINGK